MWLVFMAAWSIGRKAFCSKGNPAFFRLSAVLSVAQTSVVKETLVTYGQQFESGCHKACPIKTFCC